MIASAVAGTRDAADDTTDHELVAAIRAGDDRAFECLYRRYERRIASYIQGMVHDHCRAEDITQDVFVSALRRMRATDKPIAFKPWIYEIAKNACIDQFRRSRRGEEVSFDAEGGLGSADYGRLVTKDPSPEVRLETKQQLDHLCGAFGGLSETHHEILVMRELEGLSYREIGERMDMTRPAVESTLFRARRRLTEEYDELVTGERCLRVQRIIATATGRLGARDQRRVARHVSYCQPCLRHARASGMDTNTLAVTPLRAKIAALLPLPAFLKHSWTVQAGAMDPVVATTWGKAAAAAATIALAGVGAGVATDPPSDLRAALGGAALEERFGDDRAEGAAAAATTDDRDRSAGTSPAERRRSGATPSRRGTPADAQRSQGAAAAAPDTTAGSGSSSGSAASGGAPGAVSVPSTPAAGEQAGELAPTLGLQNAAAGPSTAGAGAPPVALPQPAPALPDAGAGSVGDAVKGTDARTAAESILGGQ